MFPRLLLAVAILSTAALAENVDILRDAYGTPHIYATTPAGAAFGAGYAQAQDRANDILRNLQQSTEPAAALPPALASLTAAYAGGVNHWLTEQHRDDRITAAQVASFARHAYSWIRASNDLILGPSRTMSRSVIAVLDPIADWNAPDRPYEMSLYAEGLAIAGVAPAGLPFPVVGHSGKIAIGWAPAEFPWPLAGPRALEEAWALINANNLAEVHRALSMNQIPGRALIGTSGGDIYDSAGALPEQGYLRRAGPSPLGDSVPIEELRVQHTWPLGRVEDLAFSTDVAKAVEWQHRIARSFPDDRFARRLTGWNRRADADSAEALAFYLFKMELGSDATSPEPPDSLSDARLLAALTRARDVLELKTEFDARFGTLFRITRDGAKTTYAVGGGNLPEAGIETPRTLAFENKRTHAGQAATRIVELSSKPRADSVLLPGISNDPDSPHFTDQAQRLAPTGATKRTYFGDRRELERSGAIRKRLIF